MPDLYLGQSAASTLRWRHKEFKDNVSDSMPVIKAMKESGGISYKDGGRTVLQEMTFAQNSNVAWVSGTGNVPLADNQIADAAEFPWAYQLAALTFSLAEQYTNSGKEKSIDLLDTKITVMESSAMNKFHAGIWSDGTGSGGLQLGGLALLVANDPTTGIVGGLNRGTTAGFYRNYALNTATSADWTAYGNLPLDVATIKRGYDKVMNKTVRGGDKVNIGLAGTGHFELLTASNQSIVQVSSETEAGKNGYDFLMYRGVKIYHCGGVNFSGETVISDNKTYFLNTKKNYLNLSYHNKGEFELLEPVYSQDQAVFTRLMFTMACMTLGFAKGQGVIFT